MNICSETSVSQWKAIWKLFSAALCFCGKGVLQILCQILCHTHSSQNKVNMGKQVFETQNEWMKKKKTLLDVESIKQQIKFVLFVFNLGYIDK